MGDFLEPLPESSRSVVRHKTMVARDMGEAVLKRDASSFSLGCLEGQQLILNECYACVRARLCIRIDEVH